MSLIGLLIIAGIVWFAYRWYKTNHNNMDLYEICLRNYIAMSCVEGKMSNVRANLVSQVLSNQCNKKEEEVIADIQRLHPEYIGRGSKAEIFIPKSDEDRKTVISGLVGTMIGDGTLGTEKERWYIKAFMIKCRYDIGETDQIIDSIINGYMESGRFQDIRENMAKLANTREII